MFKNIFKHFSKHLKNGIFFFGACKTQPIHLFGIDLFLIDSYYSLILKPLAMVMFSCVSVRTKKLHLNQILWKNYILGIYFVRKFCKIYSFFLDEYIVNFYAFLFYWILICMALIDVIFTNIPLLFYLSNKLPVDHENWRATLQNGQIRKQIIKMKK